MKSSMKRDRTIQEVLNIETGEKIIADEFFKKDFGEIMRMRSELQLAIDGQRDKLLVCYFCKQKIRIRGESQKQDHFTKKVHFAHLTDSDTCPIKTNNNLSKEDVDAFQYNGTRESYSHIRLIDRLIECLNFTEGITNLQRESIVKNNNPSNPKWRWPDIQASFGKLKVAFEAQVSITWLSEISRRQVFYKNQNFFLIWIFDKFDPHEDRQLAYSDVFYTNGENAYVFDDQCYERSKEEKKLILKCFYNRYYIEDSTYETEIEFEFVSLDELTFDKKKKLAYYFDSLGEKINVEQSINVEKLKLERKRFELGVKAANDRNSLNKIKKILERVDEELLIKRMENSKLVREVNSLKSKLAIVPELVDKWVKNDSVYHYDTAFKDDEIEAMIKDMTRFMDTDTKGVSEAAAIEFKLQSIQNLEKRDINGKTYLIIPRDWADMMRANLNKILYTRKINPNNLFQGVPLIKKINSTIDFDFFYRQSDVIFLLDHQEIITNSSNRMNTIKMELDEVKSKILTLRLKVDTKVSDSIKKRIKERETLLSENEARLKCLNARRNKLILAGTDLIKSLATCSNEQSSEID